ncbi:hypothetical protein NC653_040923 [Populus alba x Populus x berolinensis]|uniref:Uncharacterized protein n=1 Tax=Populus alba x Populus x berolinensis TaxID=444605 RepID=A0AAD6PNL1_9ROSI|nr:hypothetical protein NC653_040923 [Populus alba x Populus x berolinensis]
MASVGGEGRKKKENTEEGECMASLRPRKKKGKSWGEGAAAASLGFGRAPSFFAKYRSSPSNLYARSAKVFGKTPTSAGSETFVIFIHNEFHYHLMLSMNTISIRPSMSFHMLRMTLGRVVREKERDLELFANSMLCNKYLEIEHYANVEQPVIAELVEEAGEDLQLEIEEIRIS